MPLQELDSCNLEFFLTSEMFVADEKFQLKKKTIRSPFLEVVILPILHTFHQSKICLHNQIF